MSDENKEKSKNTDSNDNVVRGIFHTYRSEFRKIVWPSRETLTKHTVTVIIVSLMFGAYIALLDGVFGVVFGQLVQLVA